MKTGVELARIGFDLLSFGGKTLKILVIILFLTLAWVNTAQAGFGISPAQIQASNLAPGTHYEKNFNLSRGQPTEDWVANISFEFPDTPEVVKWISVEPKGEIPLPKGEQRVPLVVKIDVPKDAAYRDYNGFMRIGVGPVVEKQTGGVAISLGARIDISLNVTRVQIIDFKVRNPTIPSAEEGFHWWKINLPGKINLKIDVENTGNVKAAPYKVEIDVYDSYLWRSILYHGENESLKKLEPFEKKEITVGFWQKLKPGHYWSIVKVFKNDEEILIEEKLPVTITPMEMSKKDWLVLIGTVLGSLILLISIILKRKILVRFFKKLWPKGD